MVKSNRGVLALTEEQYEILCSTAHKLKRNMVKLDNDPASGMNKITIIRLANYFDGHADPEHLEFRLGRGSLRAIQRIANDSVETLVNKVIPGYDKRITEFPERADDYKKYREDARHTLEVMDDLLDRAEAAL